MVIYFIWAVGSGALALWFHRRGHHGIALLTGVISVIAAFAFFVRIME